MAWRPGESRMDLHQQRACFPGFPRPFTYCFFGPTPGLQALDFGYFSGSGRTEATFILPQHVTEKEELEPQLRRLFSHFHIPYDLQKLRDSAKEMELFPLVLSSRLL